MPSETGFGMDLPLNSEDSLGNPLIETESSSNVRYERSEYISAPVCVENCTVPRDILQFSHSFGYDCRRYFNLCIPDPDTIIFSSGAYIHFLNVTTLSTKFQRCSTGIGIGHIAKNPALPHIAVGETGEEPPILIYSWPDLEIITILRKGTKENFSHLSYSPDGNLLLSQGCSPDFSLTIWNWKKDTPLLRCKSHEQDIYNAIFSPTLPGNLVTSGASHVKFWKISKTFTGLKLEGALGKFGRTEISNIIGLYSMPDEKVISGCEWGNILVWEGDLIKLEVRRRNNRPCHKGMITQFEYYNGDLMSMGMDGWIRVWSYETIDQTDTSEDEGFIEIEPINEFEVIDEIGCDASMLMALEKRRPEDPEDQEWFVQDGNGGLWMIDISSLDSGREAIGDRPEVGKRCQRLFRCFSGPVTDMTSCTWGPYLAAIGSDCHLRLYDYSKKTLLIDHGFSEAGSAVYWPACSVDKTGSTIICGFESGVLRVVAVDISSEDQVRLIQAVKPHTQEVTIITMNSDMKLLATGSRDCTIFMFSVQSFRKWINLAPIGFVRVPSGVTCITCKPCEPSTFLVGCSGGHFGEVEFKAPSWEERTTYEVKSKSAFRKFRSIKSKIRREIMKSEIEREQMKRREVKRQNMEEYKAANPGIEIDEETFLEDLEEPRPLPEIFIPAEPNQVLIADYTDQGNIWLSMGGYDGGYIYEFSPFLDEDHEDNKDTETEKDQLTPDDIGGVDHEDHIVSEDHVAPAGHEDHTEREDREGREDYTDQEDHEVNADRESHMDREDREDHAGHEDRTYRKNHEAHTGHEDHRDHEAPTDTEDSEDHMGHGHHEDREDHENYGDRTVITNPADRGDPEVHEDREDHKSRKGREDHVSHKDGKATEIRKLRDVHEDLQEIEAQKATLIPKADDLELQSHLIYKNFLFLGIERGDLRVCQINREDFTDFSDYLSLPVHDHDHGDIRKILLSHDERVLFTCGSDGNIFSFVLNFDEKLEKKKFEERTFEDLSVLGDVDDIRDLDHPSLEEVIITNETNRIKALSKKNADDVCHLLRNLTREYQELMARNKKLLKSQQIPASEFVIDERITEDLKQQLKAEMDEIEERWAFKLQKSKMTLDKLMDQFVKPFTCLPFAVTRTIKSDAAVHSITEKVLGEDFHAEYAEVLRKIEAAKEVDKMAEPQPLKMADARADQNGGLTEESDVKLKIDNIANFLQEQNLQAESAELTAEMRQMLRRYNMKKAQIEKREREWEAMHASKPDPNSDHPEDVEMIESAKKTIGDYKLKISADYNAGGKARATTLSKQKELLDCRKKCHYLREEFNEKLKAVRAKKFALQNEIYPSAEKKLKAIHAEIPKSHIKELPQLKEIDVSVEFPENNLKLETYISMPEKVKEARRQKQSIMEEMMEQALDDEFRIIIPDESFIQHYSDVLPTSLTPKDKKRIKHVHIPPKIRDILKDLDNRTITPWEQEMRQIRLSKRLHEQDSLISDIKKRCEDIDRELDDLEADRIRVEVSGVYSELHQLTLQQELVILRDSEEAEALLRQKVSAKLEDKNLALAELQSATKRIEKMQKDVKNIQSKMKEEASEFTSAIQDNKYSKFLMKIFRKRVKAQTADESEESSEESSDDDDDDDDSIDLHKIALTTFDENVCPTDCARDLYDFAFEMKRKRHDCEGKIREEMKIVEALAKEVDHDTKKIRLVEGELKACEKELDEFVLEKQRKLNDVEVTVLLRFHQLQHSVNGVPAKIKDCVVFDKTRLAQLYTRVGQLQQETENQKIMHKKNRAHLHRMSVDCKYMEAEIKKLKSSIKEEMLKKFGREVSLVSLYEDVIKKLIYQMKSTKIDHSAFDKQLKCLRRKYDDHIIILETLMKDNTEKLSLLTVLNEETMKIRKLQKVRPTTTREIDWRKDLETLESILRTQRDQKELFKNDVRNLKLKVRSLPPISNRKKLVVLTKIGEKPEQNPESAKRRENLEVKEDLNLKIVKNLLSKIVYKYEEPVEGQMIVDDFFREISKRGSLPKNFVDNFGEICEKIEKRIEEVSGGRVADVLQEFAGEVGEQIDIEARGVGVGDIEISWNVKPKLDEFLDSLEIQRDVLTEVYVMKFLKMDNGVEMAADYVLAKLKVKPDAETLAALKEHSKRTLGEIQREIMESETETAQSSTSGGFA